jgi:hypothetical protein
MQECSSIARVEIIELRFRNRDYPKVILARFRLNLNFIARFSKKYSNIKFHENPSGGNRVVPCGRTDGRT